MPLERDPALQILDELEVVLNGHQFWLKQFNHALLFGDGSLDDAAPDAIVCNTSGARYFAGNLERLAKFPAFGEISKIQREMHEAAKRLCLDWRQFGRLQEEEYEHCMALSLHLNTLLRSLQLDVFGELLATDPLTGCLGRRGMLEKLKSEQERAVRLGKPYCIALMDFDNFKKINDERGHAAGDTTLRQGIQFVMSHLRKYDSLFRFGGEEFLLCLPDMPLAEAGNIVERLRAGLEALLITPEGGVPFTVTASFGVAAMSGVRTVEDTIEAADQALYRAKKAGRNWVELETPVRAQEFKLVIDRVEASAAAG